MYKFKTAAEPFGRAYLNCESNDRAYKTSAGILGMCREVNISIDKRYGLCFLRTYMENGYSNDSVTGFSYRNPNHCWPWHCDCEDNYTEEEKEDLALIRKEMEPWTRHTDVVENFYPDNLKEMMHSGLGWGGNWIGHSNPDFGDIGKYGTDALREKTEKYRKINPGKDDFYDSILNVLEAIDVLGARFAALAEEMLRREDDPQIKRRLEKIISTFDHAPQKPCRDFPEACIMFGIVFSLDGIDSPGHFDQYMIDFWNATEDKEACRERLEGLWEFFHFTRSWNLCISGSDEHGRDLTNELSYEILDLTAKHAYQTPNLTMRVHSGTPEKLLRAAYRAIATGCGMPTFYNDEAVCPALQSQGISEADSHKYVMNGCNQIDIQGKSHMGLEDGEVIFPVVLEYTLFNGREPKTGKEFGLRTGDASGFASYEEFYEAFIKQLDYQTDLSCEMANCGQKAFAENAPNPFRSILIEGCMEKGVDYSAGGPVYNNGQILAEGIADTADSLAAIKKYVFEEKRYTMAQLTDALEKNFAGYDEMYNTLKNSDLRFGNDIDYVDSIAADMVDHFNGYLMTKKVYRGGIYTGGCSPYNRAAGYGSRIGALPNGKKADETLIADSIGATPGSDSCGPTATLNSCLKFNHKLPGSGFILNLKFDKSVFNTKEGEEAFLGIVRSYFGRGGQNMTFTVVSPDELIDAKKNPQNHKNLIVRVGGYSDYFIDLESELQDNVIARTYNEI